MNTVYGFVKVKETDEPIAGLIVLVASRDVSKTLSKVSSRLLNPFEAYKNRKGSAITNGEGAFQIEFDMLTTPNEEPADHMLAIIAPATTIAINKPASTSPYDKLLYWVKLPRLSSNQTEALTVRLADDQLKNVDVQTTGRRQKTSVERQIAFMVEAEKNSEEFRLALQKELAPAREKRRERKRQIISAARTSAACLSATQKAALSQRNFVLSKEQSENARQFAVEEGLKKMANAASRVNVVTSVYLDENSLARIGVTGPAHGEMIRISTDKLCQLMNERRGGTELARVRGLLDAYKAAAEAKARLTDQEDVPVKTEDDAPAGDQPAGDEEASASAIVKRVMGQLKDMPIGTAASADKLPRALTRDELNAMLPAIQLGAGPADVPSFHDFYHLQMAFLHVWTEAFDQELRSDVQKLYEEYVELHHDLYGDDSIRNIPEISEIKDLRNFLKEFGREDSFPQSYPYYDQTRRFLQSLGYALETLGYLGTEQQNQLNDLACAWWSLYVNDPDDPGVKNAVEQIRHILEHPLGIKTRLDRLLYQIAHRLNEPYSFHYFEPNSVNFGLMLTYRQYWQPGLYQVGDLVSTIPLAPGEKRRFETKQTVKRSRAETEMAKSMSSKSFESTTTQRADAEITERASMRSNFQMTAEGSFRFAIGEISSGTQFGIDQSQESSRVKKDFREAVLKSRAGV
jgi:hypothetical protein